MNEIDFINKWIPNGFENPYSNFCFKLDLKELKEHIRAEVIEECINGLCDDWRLEIILCKEDKYNLIQFLKLYAKQLKEQINEHI